MNSKIKSRRWDIVRQEEAFDLGCSKEGLGYKKSAPQNAQQPWATKWLYRRAPWKIVFGSALVTTFR